MNNASNITRGPLSQHYYNVLTVLGLLGFLFNAVLLFVLWRNKTPEFRSGTSYVIGNLALADCLTGFAAVLYGVGNTQSALFQVPMVWTTIAASLMSLVFLSVERTIAFHYPFTSKAFLTVRRTVMAIVIIWILGITCGVFVYFYKSETQFAMTIIFEVCVVVFLVNQAYIVAKMQQRKRKHLFCDRDVSLRTKKYICGQSRNMNVTKVVLILIVVVVVTLLPYMLALQMYYLLSLKLRPSFGEKNEHIIDDFIDYYYPIELMNFVVNPIIYAYRLQRYRKAFFRAFSFLPFEPFVKQRGTRYFSESGEHNEEKARRKTLMMKNDPNLNHLDQSTKGVDGEI